MSIKDTLKIIGAVAPSSNRLARAMLRYYEQGPILEVGAGTGAITRILAQKDFSGQKIDVVEILPKFAQMLQKRYGNLAIHHCNILDFKPEIKYQLIVSSLPFNAFSPDLLEAILDKLICLSSSGAVLSFFEYKILQGLAPLILSKVELDQYRRTRALIDSFIARYQFDETVVNLNMPPAVVHYLRIDKSGV